MTRVSIILVFAVLKRAEPQVAPSRCPWSLPLLLPPVFAAHFCPNLKIKSLLAEDLQGRIDITRTFDGRELNTEYLFGLLANLAAEPNSISLLGVPISYEILHFPAKEYITSAATRFMFNFTSLGLVVPIEIDSWNTWNEVGQITQYEVSFKYWQWTVAYIIASRCLSTSYLRFEFV
jgi:hypothetical protein